MADTPVYLKRRVLYPFISRAVIREDGVHYIEHSGRERPWTEYDNLHDMNEQLRALGFPEFEEDTSNENIQRSEG